MSAPATSVAAIILAAGESRRFGGPKLLASLDGRPLVQHVIDAANASSCEPVVLVVGAGADELLASVRLGRSRVVRNAAYATGQASSLQAGLTAATSADAAVVLLADMPGVRAGAHRGARREAARITRRCRHLHVARPAHATDPAAPRPLAGAA